MTKELPAGLAPHRRTDTFSADTVPAGLLQDHKTRAGTWGVLHVLSGEVVFTLARSGAQTRLCVGEEHVIEPEVLHSVGLSNDAEFYVEFWR